jgi:inner membrane protein
MIESLITERQSYKNEAVKEVSNSWAGAQTIGGPILTIQSKIEKTNQAGNKYFESSTHHYLPDSLKYYAEVMPEKRSRGIYEVILYTAKISITGSINIQKISNDIEGKNLIKSFISININDIKGIQNDPQLKIDGAFYNLLPGLINRDVYSNGLYTEIQLNKNSSKLDFSLDIQLSGINDLSFLPVGKLTETKIKSTWNNPSFAGAFLPASRKITDDGFTAEWEVNYFNRNYPQNWEGNSENISSSVFGVKFLQPVDEYQKTMRISKYGLLIIVLTFLSFFMIELFSKKAIHPIQYLLVGLALILFYSLLLSISEYISFDYSYLFSALAVIFLVGLYTKSIYGSFKIGSIIFSILVGVYGFIYIILQLQDYSLLAGNIALFFILAVVMYLTRKFNWYEVLSSKSNS